MRFTKMHGAGNDYVYVNGFEETVPADLAALARDVSDRHFGVGGDGLILILPSDVADARMRMFNADGSEAEMCGNGIRCLAKYVYDYGICRRENLKIETLAGVLSLDLEVDGDRVARVRVDMGQPILEANRIPTTLDGPQVVDREFNIGDRTIKVTCVSMGNPHCVVYADQLDDVTSVEEMDYDLLKALGRRIETDPRFPQRVNVEFVEVVSATEVRQRTWERGSGETLACGTGASAVCVAGVLTGRTQRKILNHLSGGDLELQWNESDNRVFMTGPAAEVFSGDWPADGLG